MRADRSASRPSMIPSAVTTPARNSSAMTSTMPEPHTPVTPSSAVASAKPGSSDHRSEPMILKRGSRVRWSIRTRSMAPGAARGPPPVWGPPKAGPRGGGGGGPQGAGHLAGAPGVHHRVRDAAHEVLAEADLRVHHPVRGED